MSTEHTEPAPLWLIRLIWVALFFAILRSFYPPNAFTATVLIFDYEYGLIRRGFWGEILNLYWGETVSKSEVFAASAVLTLTGIAALVALFYRSFSSSLTGAKLLLLFVCSFAFAALIGATGYIDLPLIALVSLALLTDPTRLIGIALRTAVVVAGLFMHEVMLPYFAVYLVFDIWYARPDLRRAPLALLPLVAGITTFAFLTLWGQLAPSDVQGYITHIETKSEFTAEPDATIVMERTLFDNLAMMSEKRGMLDYRSWALFDGIPLLIMSLWLITLNLRLLPSTATLLTKLLLFSAILAPLSLNIIAFDVVRFGAVSVLIGFLTLLTQWRTDTTSHPRLAAILTWPLCIIVLVLNLNVTVNQMNTGDAQDYAVPWALIKQLDWIK